MRPVGEKGGVYADTLVGKKVIFGVMGLVNGRETLIKGMGIMKKGDADTTVIGG